MLSQQLREVLEEVINPKPLFRDFEKRERPYKRRPQEKLSTERPKSGSTNVDGRVIPAGHRATVDPAGRVGVSRRNDY